MKSAWNQHKFSMNSTWNQHRAFLLSKLVKMKSAWIQHELSTVHFCYQSYSKWNQHKFNMNSALFIFVFNASKNEISMMSTPALLFFIVKFKTTFQPGIDPFYAVQRCLKSSSTHSFPNLFPFQRWATPAKSQMDFTFMGKTSEIFEAHNGQGQLYAKCAWISNSIYLLRAPWCKNDIRHDDSAQETVLRAFRFSRNPGCSTQLLQCQAQTIQSNQLTKQASLTSITQGFQGSWDLQLFEPNLLSNINISIIKGSLDEKLPIYEQDPKSKRLDSFEKRFVRD